MKISIDYPTRTIYADGPATLQDMYRYYHWWLDQDDQLALPDDAWIRPQLLEKQQFKLVVHERTKLANGWSCVWMYPGVVVELR